MKPLKVFLAIGLQIIVFSACNSQRMQRNYATEIVVEEYVNNENTVIIYQSILHVELPTATQSSTDIPVTKIRTNINEDNSKKIQRDSSNNDKNVRNNSGQRNTKSRGK